MVSTVEKRRSTMSLTDRMRDAASEGPEAARLRFETDEIGSGFDICGV